MIRNSISVSRFIDVALVSGMVFCLLACLYEPLMAAICGESCVESCYTTTEDFAFGECERCEPATCRSNCALLCDIGGQEVIGECSTATGDDAFVCDTWDMDYGSGECSDDCAPAFCSSSHPSTTFNGNICSIGQCGACHKENSRALTTLDGNSCTRLTK